MRFYIAGPLFSLAERNFNSDLADEIKRRVPGCDIFLPQRDVDPRQSADKIARACLKGLEDSSVMIAILDGPDVDSGTAFEIGYAYSFRATILGLRTDFRNCGDTNVFEVNAMFSLIPKIYKTQTELLDAIDKL